MLIKNKKADDPSSEGVIFIVLVALFIGIVIVLISRAGTGSDTVEKVYARQIALVIDNLRPGTTAVLYLPELFDNADKNKFTGNIFNIDFENQIITIKTAEGDGNGFHYFNEIKSGRFSFDSAKKTVTITK